MRPALEELAIIDRYLSGDLSPQEIVAFEKLMETDADFRQSVELQQDLQQVIARQALMGEIEAAHQRHIGQQAVPPTKSGGFMAFLRSWKGLVLGAVALVGLLAIGRAVHTNFWGEASPEIAQQPLPQPEASDPTLALPLEEIQPQDLKQNSLTVESEIYTVDPSKRERIVYPRSGTVIEIPANSMVDQEGNAVEGKVTIAYREFRDQADIAASNIPMTYKDQDANHRFNSAGMFEIRATSEEGEEVFLKDGEQMDMAFPMTDELPGTNFYQLNEETREWEFLHPIAESETRPQRQAKAEMVVEERYSQNTPENDPSVAEGATEQNEPVAELENSKQGRSSRVIPFRMNLELPYEDTLRSIEWAIKMGRIEARKKKVQDIFAFDPPQRFDSFDHRFRNFDFVGLQERENLSEKVEYIKLVQDQQIAGSNLFKFDFDNEAFPELVQFKRATWEILAHDLGVENFKIVATDYSDIRVTQAEEPKGWFSSLLGQNEQFYFELKGPEQHWKIPVRIDRSSFPSDRKPRKKEMVNIVDQLMSSYYGRINPRRDKFDQAMDKLESDYRDAYNRRLKSFYDASGLFMELGEFQMEQKDWLKLFKTFPKEMQTRYDSLWQVSQANGNDIQWIRDEFDRLEAEFTRNNERYPNRSGRQITFEETVLIDELQEPGAVRGNVEPVAVASQSLRPMIGTAQGIAASNQGSSLVRQLAIPGFGVYNCDQLYRQEQPVNVMASYRDVNGGLIADPYQLTTIDLRQNGSYSFNPNMFSISQVGRNYLLLYTTSGKTYFLDEETFRDMNVQEPGRYTFPMREVSDELASVNDLRDLLGLKPTPALNMDDDLLDQFFGEWP